MRAIHTCRRWGLWVHLWATIGGLLGGVARAAPEGSTGHTPLGRPETGVVLITISGVSAAELSVDGEPEGSVPTYVNGLEAGTHTFTLQVGEIEQTFSRQVLFDESNMAVVKLLWIPPIGPASLERPLYPDPWPEVPEAQEAEAEELFLLAMASYKVGRYREAGRSFVRSLELAPSGNVAFNAARAHEAMGEHELALGYYELALLCGLQHEQALEQIAEGRRRLEERVETRAFGALVVTAPTLTGSKLEIDGELVGRLPVEIPKIVAGPHLFLVHSPRGDLLMPRVIVHRGGTPTALRL